MEVKFSTQSRREDLLLAFTALPDFRIIHVPDSMFHVRIKDHVTRTELLPLAQKLVLNEIRIEDETFTYTCPEIGITWCSQYRAKHGLAQVWFRFFYHYKYR